MTHIQKKLYGPLLVGLLVAFALWSGDVHAQRMREGRPEGRNRSNQRGTAPDEIYDRLQLTEQQKVRLEKNRMQYHEQIKSLNEQLTHLRRQLNMELERRQLDRKRVDTIKAQIDRLQLQLSDLRLQSIMAIREILTPEQYEIFSEMME